MNAMQMKKHDTSRKVKIIKRLFDKKAKADEINVIEQKS